VDVPDTVEETMIKKSFDKEGKIYLYTSLGGVRKKCFKKSLNLVSLWGIKDHLPLG